MSITVGIAGLTSKFAQCVVKELQAYPDVTVKGFCRSPQKLSQEALAKYKVDVIQGEFDDEVAVQRFVRGTDIVICCYFGDPDVMTRGQKILVDACAKEGVPRYLPSDFAVDYTKIPAHKLFPKESCKTMYQSSLTMTTGAGGEKPFPNWSPVAGYLTGLQGLTRKLAIDPKPVRVNLVSPGVADTPLHSPGGLSDEMKRYTALGKFGTPEEVAVLARAQSLGV